MVSFFGHPGLGIMEQGARLLSGVGKELKFIDLCHITRLTLDHLSELDHVIQGQLGNFQPTFSSIYIS